MPRLVRPRSFVVALVLLVPVAAAALGFASGRSSSPPIPPVIATFDLDKVIAGLAEYKAMQDEAKQKAELMRADLDKKSAAIQSDQKTLETMPDGPEKKALGQRMIKDSLQLKFDSEIASQFMEQLTADQMREILGRIAAATKELAVRNKYTMVVADDSDARPARGAVKDVLGAAMSRRLWYVEPAHDVTAELILSMNNAYAAGAKP